MERKEDYIAVFDSGVGGLSVLRQLRRLMPGEKYLYFGDSANAPYGIQSTERVRALTLAAARRLFREKPCKALVLACNTATAAAVEDLRRAYPERIIVGIEPAVKLAADRYPGGTVGVMATQVTLREEKFDALRHRFDGGCRILSIPAPGLVELVEAGEADAPACYALMRELLAPYAGQLDALVLGCTHYPFAARAIAAALGPGVELLEGGPGTARETRRRLAERDLLECGPGELILENSREDGETLALCRRLMEMGR